MVWMLDEAVLEADAHGIPVWHGVLYDISERKTAEIDLQRSSPSRRWWRGSASGR